MLYSLQRLTSCNQILQVDLIYSRFSRIHVKRVVLRGYLEIMLSSILKNEKMTFILCTTNSTTGTSGWSWNYILRRYKRLPNEEVHNFVVTNRRRIKILLEEELQHPNTRTTYGRHLDQCLIGKALADQLMLLVQTTGCESAKTCKSSKIRIKLLCVSTTM